MKIINPRIYLVTKLALLFVFIISNGIAQESKFSTSGLDRINTCFIDSRYKIFEKICLYYNHTFTYHYSDLSADVYKNSKGTYFIQNDTVFLNSKAPPSFVISAKLNPAIPKGKIKVRFKNFGKNSYYVALCFDEDDYTALEREKKEGNDYYVLAKRPVQGILKLAHDLYDVKGTEYHLDPNKNEFTVSLSNSIGRVGFDNFAFVLQGTDLRPASDWDRMTLYTRMVDSPISYKQIPWVNNIPELTESEFATWNEKQNRFFLQLEEENKKLIAEQKEKKEKEKLSHIVYDWSTAIRKAKEDSSGIIAFFRVDSIPSINSDGEPMDSAIASLKNPKQNQYLITDYYNAFYEEDWASSKTPRPVFYYYRDSGESIKRKFQISSFPAIVITDSRGEPFFKIEGTIATETELLDLYQRMLKNKERLWQDSVINAFKSAKKDSLSLTNMILALENLNEDQTKALKDAGISSPKLLDDLVSNYISPNCYSLRFYDFVFNIYKNEKSIAFSNLESVHSISPTLEWLAGHFDLRQLDSSFLDRKINDSLLLRIYISIRSGFYYSFRDKDLDSVNYSKLLTINKMMITGQNHYFDFYSSLGYLENQFELIKSKKMVLPSFEKEVNGFFESFSGGFVTVSSAIALGRSLYREANERNYLSREYDPNADELVYISQVRTTLSYLLSQLIEVKLMRSGDSSLSSDAIKKGDLIKLFELAENLSARPDFYMSKRNYAYALYMMGDFSYAIELMQEVINSMKGGQNKYLALGMGLQKIQSDLALMKAKKKVNFLITNLTSFQ